MERVEEFSARYYGQLVQGVLEESRRRGISPVHLARRAAEREFPERDPVARSSGLVGKLLDRVKTRVQTRRSLASAALRSLEASVRGVSDGLAGLDT